MNRKLFPEKSPKELLDQFRQSGSEEPFEEIMRRYAAMVYGVCLRVTGDKHDAEDATQAVFLSLALQAKTSREIIYVGPWLQKVAHRLALDVKKANTRRKKRESRLAEQNRYANGNGHHAGPNGNGHVNGSGFFGGQGQINPADAPQNEERKRILLEELNNLPAKYRMPLVLHYFGGLSREQMAAELGCNPSTLGVRVHRGKGMLGRRLSRRGVALSAIALGVVLEHVVRTTTMQPLVTGSATAASAAGLFAGGGMAMDGGVLASAKVLALTRTISRSLVYAKLKVALTLAIVVASAAVTTGAVARYIDLPNLVLPSLKLGDWIRPLLRSLTPAPLASGAPADASELPLATRARPIRVPGDLPQMIVLSSTTSESPAGEKVASAGAPAVAGTVVVDDAPGVNVAAVALTVVAPLAPVRVRQPDAPAAVESHPVSVAGVSGQAGADEPEADNPVFAGADTADGGDFLIGAGGGGGFGGKAETYVMPPNVTLRSNNQTIGDTGSALFRQSGGANIVADTLTLGRQDGSSGTYEMTGGKLSARSEIIGDAGDGSFIQTSGVNVAQDSIIIGRSGSGTYTQGGDGQTVVLNSSPTSDPAVDPNGLHLAQEKSASATFVLQDNAALRADPQIIGGKGSATFSQSGGTNTTGAIAIATEEGSTGEYKLDKGDLVVEPRATNQPQAAISIGGKGTGKFTVGDSNSTGKIYEIGRGGSSVVIRGKPRGDGSLVGHGKVKLTGGLANNGQVVADGMRAERSLDLSSFSWVTSTIENPRWGGTSGWFARREGKLILPSVTATAGNGTYTWGEDAGDPMIDLVNSVRFTIKGAQSDGDVDISLLSPLRDDIPTLPVGHKFIGLWAFEAAELQGFNSIGLSVRYDDAMAATLGLDENLLKLWYYGQSDQQWHRINDASFNRNTLDHLLSGVARPDLSYFAVSAPEPTGAMVLLVAGGLANLRRRRR